MACLQLAIAGLLLAYATAQMPAQGFYHVPATAFNRGRRVDFSGLSLGQICRQIMMMGGKEALSDGMGMAARWLANQRVSGQVAGGSDPQMQCLFNQASISGSPGNMIGDYYDTVIEYPMILDPCTAPQCNGKVNPTVLLMQTFAPMMRMGGMGGMGGMGPGFGGGMPGAPAPLGQNPLLSALMPQPLPAAGPAPLPVASANAPNATQNVPAAAGSAPGPVAGNAATPNQLPQGNPMASLLQNPQMMQMMQMIMQMFGNNQRPAAANPVPVPPAAGFPAFNGLPNFGGFPASMFL